ncbi:nucleotidyltransferase domain-containing protein [Shewanella baltica]|uniref:nucleotidyltransferase domain-containing protein n=1 Tax=Shewanella baltica TaxID=62322 RepID=UPI003D78BA23
MNIDSKITIAGLPALDARKLVSCIPFETNGFSVRCFANRFEISQQLAKTRIEAFESEGYFEKLIDDGKKTRWQLTMKAATLSQASAAKKVKRATADQHYQAFLARVDEINFNDSYLYRVTKVALFGSYLSGTGPVSDIDLFVWIARKPKFEADFTHIRKKRTKVMLAEGRRFRDLSEELHWPELDVRKYLKNGSRVISIQGHNEGYEQFEHEIVFEINRTT